ncbi:hypothetical protein [Burkholderia sp. BCC0322]|nr:hypothetical protein [Burkholderia sp. BCC0322]
MNEQNKNGRIASETLKVSDASALRRSVTAAADHTDIQSWRELGTD